MDNNLKPREKIKRSDINSLSDAELLAIILGSGTKQSDVIATANQLLIECNGLARMQSCEIDDFRKIHGIGEVKSLVLYAIFEISKRTNKEKYYLERTEITKPEIVFDLCKPMISYTQEKVVVLSLNVRMELISKNEIYVGELTSVTIQPREIFKTVFVKSAYAFILVHNHPSGYCEPSDDDLIATSAIAKGAKMLNVLFIDHIVVAKDGFYSIRSNHQSVFSG
ncbi:DNA repair protein RadC [Mollicutes bacterium LVI A0039]|nr:DNA repair protein RadC [Mollicutes bacterium LVI A0039]